MRALPVPSLVILPSAYNTYPTCPYATFYLLHGAGETYKAWSLRANLTALADNYSTIIVTPDGGENELVLGQSHCPLLVNTSMKRSYRQSWLDILMTTIEPIETPNDEPSEGIVWAGLELSTLPFVIPTCLVLTRFPELAAVSVNEDLVHFIDG
eukprot:CAMPEP_0178542324 /NCGR_PEP_ID=MMETSP0697-20121206/2002_1 /TAXON_ID=265572 /ORGANISM="Extubocellulus spinifer, Strain CCMP396" /LENGTH=153 /DNA_ID=CAMNT_0020174725 /DNA_START=696 /DNA_END=1156 /DNA_ORIENTATION=-